MTELGRWIEKQLKKTDRTTDDLAKAMAIDMGTLNEIISGSIKRPPDQRLSAIAKFFGVSVDTVRGLIAGSRLDSGADVRSGDRMVNAMRVALSDSAQPGQDFCVVRIVPDGLVHGNNEDFFIDGESFDAMLAEFQAHGTQLPIDYEHQTLGGSFSSPDGAAPAAGWIESLFYRRGQGIFANVQWTQRAGTMIRAKEYKYLSPVLVIRKKDRKAVRLHSAGLTNKPAIEHMDVLAAKEHTGKEKVNMEGDTTMTAVADSPQMLLGAIMQELGISLDTTDIVEGLKAVLDKVSQSSGDTMDAAEGKAGEGTGEVANKMRQALSLKEDATTDEFVVAINGLKRAAGNDGATKIAALEDQLAELNADKVLDPYLKANKINPHDAEDMAVCRSLAKSDPKALAHQMKHRAPYVQPGRSVGQREAGDGGKRSRETIIANAAREYDGDGYEGRLTDRDSFVNAALIGAGARKLDEKERENLIL